MYVGAEESNVAADSRGTGRDARNVGGCAPGLTAGGGGNDEVVCGVGVDGATDSRVKGLAEETAGGCDHGLAASKGGLERNVCGIGAYNGMEECHDTADGHGTGRANRANGGRDRGSAGGEVVIKGIL